MNKPYTLLYRLLLLVVLAAFFGQTHAQVSAGDSLSLVAFYHSTGGAAWTDNTGWLTGNVSGWYGVTVRGGHVTRLSLPSDNLTGPVPASLANLDSLVYLDLSGNDLTSFPSLSGRHLDTLDLAGNALTFKDLVPNRAVADSFYYSPQDSVDVFEDTTVVEQGSVSLKALVDYSPSVGDNYEWIKDSTVIVSSASDSYTILCADSADAGTYYCVITNSQLPKLTLHRRVAILAVQRLANAGASYHVCDSSTSLQGVAAPAGGSQSWSLVSGGAAISYPDSAVTAVTSLSIGANVFQYSVSAGNISCPAGTYSTALLTVTRDTNPAPAYAGANFSVCGPQALLSADSPSVGTGTWTVISLGAATVAQPNDPVTAVNSLSSGVNIFRWQIVNGACAPAYFSEVKVFRDDTLTTVSAGSDTSICATSYVLASQLPADTRWAWSVAAGTGIFSADSSGQVFENDTTVTTPVSGLSEGLNTYTWTVSNSCNSVSASVHVTVYNFTMANAGPNEQLFYSPIHTYPVGDTVAVGTGGTGQYSYVWSPATNIDSTGTEHPDFLTPGAGVYTYSVTVTDGHGCTASSSVTYTVVQEVSLTVPTLFTPNGDGVNDLLYIPGIESYPGNELTVVDRNDQLVYKKTGYANDWGGINELGFSRQGQLLPADTYYYTLKLEDGKALQRGFFLIKY